MKKTYIEQGFYIFPCIKSNDPKIDKSPITKNGFYDASNNIKTVKKQFYKDDLLIGLPTGQKNGIVIIDFDQNKKFPGTDIVDTRTVQELGEEVVNNYGPLPETFQVETPSGGRHLYYLVPEGVEIKGGTRFLDDSLMIDLKADGGYVIAPDGVHYTVYDDVDDKGIEDIKSRCAILPDWVIKARQKQPEIQSTPQNIVGTILPDSEVREIQSALECIPSDNYDSWYQTGMMLKSTGDARAFQWWDEWSSKDTRPGKYQPDKMQEKWSKLTPKNFTIASLFYEAKKYGWVTTYEKKPIATTTKLPDEITKKEIKEHHQKKPFPDELLRPNGLVGDMIDYILQKSIIPQPVFALSAALCAVGTLAGRKVQTETGLRTNLYCVNVGQSGSGKEAPRKAIKDIFYHAGCSEMASVEDLASDASIVTEMDKNNSQVFLIDEIGRFLETTKNGPAHLSNIITVLLKMYSEADQTYGGKSYADAEKKKTIEQPNLCLLGSTTQDTLYNGLKYENIKDGLLARILAFETDNNMPRKKRGSHLLAKPSVELIDQVKALKNKPINLFPEGNLDADLKPRPQIVPMNENAYEILLNFEEYIYKLREKLVSDGRFDAVYNRTAEMGERIALIVATGINIDNPVITEYEMSYGISLAHFLADQMLYIVEHHMSENNQEHEVKKVLKLIRNSACISIKELTKKTQGLQGKQRTDILQTLIVSDDIEEHFVETGNTVTKMYSAKK